MEMGQVNATDSMSAKILLKVFYLFLFNIGFHKKVIFLLKYMTEVIY